VRHANWIVVYLGMHSDDVDSCCIQMVLQDGYSGLAANGTKLNNANYRMILHLAISLSIIW